MGAAAVEGGVVARARHLKRYNCVGIQEYGNWDF
jgi:hypothetical protein